MFDTAKTYVVEVLAKNIAPKVSSAVIAYGVTFLVAHQEFMEQMGITYYPSFNGAWHGAAPTGRLLVIEFDTLSIWGGAALVMGAMALIALFQHHVVATATGAPQSGNVRTTGSPAIEGGARQGDPKP